MWKSLQKPQENISVGVFFNKVAGCKSLFVEHLRKFKMSFVKTPFLEAEMVSVI